MRIYTDVKTLKEVWNLLKELSLSELLTGGEVKIDPRLIFDKLLSESKLNEFCQIITRSEEDFEQKELPEILEIIGNFFRDLGKQLSMSLPKLNLNLIPKTTNQTSNQQD